MDTHELITIEDAAKRMSVNRVTIYRWIRQGMPVVEIGTKRKRVNYQAVLEWLHSGGAKKQTGANQ